MSHFNMENEINGLLRMDAPLTRGPLMRWQRKLNESCNNSLRNDSMNNSAVKTPLKMANGKERGSNNLNYNGNTSRTPNKTPNKTPGKKGTPGRGNKTPSGADRFIPSRAATQFDLGHHLLGTSKFGRRDEAEQAVMSPSQRDYRNAMSDKLNGDKMDSKILSYKSKAPSVPDGYQSNLKVLYSANGKLPGSVRKTTRHIPQVPERILDAPEILDDYYLNLIDWSCNNLLAVSLAGHVYLWNAATGDIQQLMEVDNAEDYITCVSWIKEGNYLAVGTSNADVQLWDVVNQKRVRCMTGHAARVGALSWNNHILSSGSRSGMIHHHDVRQADHLVGQAAGHTQEVCGLRWSPDGRFLASGGNDNLLHIWGEQSGLSYSGADPTYTFSQHQAAVKALAWCPWQPSLLASGGGTADRHIRFWNCNSGSCLSSVDTKSQVCSLLWSKEYKELISSHGFAHNQLIIWKYPNMTKVSELTGHTARVLHMGMSPDGTTVVSAAADETLRLWKCFSVDADKKQVKKAIITSQPGTLRQSIR